MRVREQVDALGRLRLLTPGSGVGNPEWCQPLSVWKARYTGWVRDPVRREIYPARALFDLRGICEPSPLLDDLRRHIARELDGNDAFIAVLANDTLANQPPLTFFHGLVIDDEETESAHLDIVRSALQPLTDVGRVFALDQGAVWQTSTWERFDRAGITIASSRRSSARRPRRSGLRCSTVRAPVLAAVTTGRLSTPPV